MPPFQHPDCGYFITTRSDTANALNHENVERYSEQLPSKKLMADIRSIVPELRFTKVVSETLLRSANRPAPFASFLKNRYVEYGIDVANAGTEMDEEIMASINTFSYPELVKTALSKNIQNSVFENEPGSSKKHVGRCHVQQTIGHAKTKDRDRWSRL